MSIEITSLVIALEGDVVRARQQARFIAERLGFDLLDQTKFSTAVSEVTRNAFVYAGGGTVTFHLEGDGVPQMLAVTVRDAGPGIGDLEAVLRGSYASRTGLGLGLTGTRRLMDTFFAESPAGEGTTVFFGKFLPRAAGPFGAAHAAAIRADVVAATLDDPLEVVRVQNQELMRTLKELRERQEELIMLNAELEETNKGVLALYAELDDKAGQLSRANELKARFLSGMSHEFRTPLNSILALSALLIDRVDGDLSGEQEKQVAFIRRSAEDLEMLTADLLDQARIEAGKTAVVPASFSAAELLAGLRGMFRPLPGKDEVRLVVEDPDPSLPTLFTDEGKVSQILRNLVSNGLKYTERGEVRVRVAASPDGTAAEFVVSDTGVGIAPEDEERIFDEYFRVEGQSSSRPRGTGLGLPISRRLAQALGGSLTVRSEPGAGSEFTATIPWRYSEPGPDELVLAGAEALQLPARGGEVLIVEDDAATRLTYEAFLRDTPFVPVLAATMQQAREALATHSKPVAVILDVLMDEGESWDLLADLKADPATRDVPVLVVSVLREQAKATVLGAADYCVKPVERSWLLAKLSALALTRPVRTVLVIDDEPVARYILKGYLADTPYRLLEAAGGEEGLALARSGQADVIFLDLIMPGMNGFEVLHALREGDETRDIPVIVSTAHELTPDERLDLGRSAQAILSKQSSGRAAAREAVLDALRSVLDPSQPGGQVP